MKTTRIIFPLAASLAGAGALPAAGRFDREYARRTVAEQQRPVAADAASAVCLTLGAVLYGAIPGDRKSPLYGGVAVGLFTYLLACAGLLPATRLAPWPWKQKYPQVAGGLLRHVIAGVTAAAVFGAADDWL